MPNKKPKTVYYRRKREGRTNYRKRRKLLSSHKTRLVVRLTNRKIIAQLVNFTPKGDTVIAGVTSEELKKYGWNFSLKNLPAAYLTGYLIGQAGRKKGIAEAILDLGFRLPVKGNRIYACLKGAVEAGLRINSSEEVFPSEERIKGKHIEQKDSAQKISEAFQNTKKKIEEGKK